MNITSEVKEIILQLPKNQLFNSREIYERYFIDFCMESTYSKIINRMQKDELIYMLQNVSFICLNIEMENALILDNIKSNHLSSLTTTMAL
jgi:hypothetical protein